MKDPYQVFDEADQIFREADRLFSMGGFGDFVPGGFVTPRLSLFTPRAPRRPPAPRVCSYCRSQRAEGSNCPNCGAALWT